VKEKNIAGFFRGIGVEGLSSGNVARIIQAGFDSVPKIINMSINDLLTVEGFKIKMATKVYDGIKEGLNKASLVTIMSATNLFGRGFSEKRLELIMNEYPDVLLSGENREEKIKKIANIKGMAEKTAEAFVDKINDFVSFINTAGLENKLIPLNPSNPSNQIDKTNQIEENKIINTTNPLHPLYNKTIVMTGFRDKELELNLKKIGAKSGSSVSKNTFVVIIKSNDSDESGKVIDAKKIGVPIMTLDEFKSKFNI
jgi:NAD-dependent DNA ligase